MPELRTRPRRGFQRQLPPPRSPVTGTAVEVTPRQRRLAAGGAVLATAGLLALAVATVVDPFAEEPPTAEPPRTPATAPATASRPTRPAATTAASGGVATDGRRTVLAAAQLPEVQRALVAVRDMLSRIQAEETNDGTFRPRMQVFKTLLDALPDPDKRSLFPMISAAAIEELFASNPQQACALLDKLLQRARILMV